MKITKQHWAGGFWATFLISTGVSLFTHSSQSGWVVASALGFIIAAIMECEIYFND